MIVSVSELQNNLEKYLDASKKETVFVTDHEEIIAEIDYPSSERLRIMRSLRGSVPTKMSLEEARDRKSHED